METCLRIIPTISRVMLFEAFLIFYMLEILVLVSVAVWDYHEPKPKEKKIWDPWGVWKEIK